MLKSHFANSLTSAFQLGLLLVGFQLESRAGWVGVLALVALLSLIAWVANQRRYRLIADTPTSKVASAAQGYVELHGRAENHPGQPIVSRLTALPCVWYRYRVERKAAGDKNWEKVEEGVSEHTFLLRDASGTCVLDPDLAEVVSNRRQVWVHGEYRYTETLLLPQDPLYALGEFVSLGGAGTMLDPKADMDALLAEWKRDRAQLLRRFDLNRDGEIDLEEWELARAEAKRTVQKQHREIRQQDAVHVLRKPVDERLFLLSNLAPERLVAKYRRWGWFHLAMFIVACGAAARFAV